MAGLRPGHLAQEGSASLSEVTGTSPVTTGSWAPDCAASFSTYALLRFDLGLVIPALPPALTAPSTGERPDPILLLSALGTLAASLAALVSLSVFVFDGSPAVICSVSIAVAWLTGVTMQLVAGG